jgi:hypothetical protein
VVVADLGMITKANIETPGASELGPKAPVTIMSAEATLKVREST